MGPVQGFLRQPIIFSDCRVAAEGCHKMCRIALILCRHCSTLTFVSSQSVILRVNLVCKCFPSSTARCICHISCVTLVPSLKIQSFYSCCYFFSVGDWWRMSPFPVNSWKIKSPITETKKQVSIALISDFHAFLIILQAAYVLSTEVLVQFHLCRFSVLWPRWVQLWQELIL